MFTAQILEMAIGLVFLYFSLSLLCSVAIEMVTSLTKKRPRMLKEGILSLLRDPDALNKLYEQPFFMGKTTPKNLWGSIWESLTALWPWKKKDPVPSYISSRTFVLSLLESLKQYSEVIKNLALPGKVEQILGFKDKLQHLPETSQIKQPLLALFQGDDKAILESIRDWYEKVKNQAVILNELSELIPTIDDLANIKQLVAVLPRNNDIRGALMPLLESAGKDIDKAFEGMEKWYDEAMRWIRFSWTRDWEIISDPGGSEDGKRAGW
jgi:hypothetical protein